MMKYLNCQTAVYLPSPAGKGDHVVVDEEVTFFEESNPSEKPCGTRVSVGV